MSSNYQVVLKAVIQKITQAELDKAVAGLNIKIKTQLDTASIQSQVNQVSQAVQKAGGTSGGINIINTQGTLNQLGLIQKRIDAIKAMGGTVTPPTTLKGKDDEIYQASIKYADAQGTAVTETYKLVDAKGKVTRSVEKAVGFERQLTKETKEVSNINNNLANTLTNNAKKVAEWAISTALIYGTLNEIRQAMQYIVDLNKQMTGIQMVTGMSGEDANKLAGDYNVLAKELGATTLEIAKGSLEWFRQGKTIEQVSELMDSTMKLSKLGNIESAQATEYLTSTLNGFNLEAEDAISIVDKLVILDNNYATSVAEIASALQRSSNSARQAGVDFDELASYITVVSSVTRKSAESIGESFPR